MREIWKMPMREQIEAMRTGTLRLGMGKDNTPRGMILYGADEKRLLSSALCIERFTKPITPPEVFG